MNFIVYYKEGNQHEEDARKIRTVETEEQARNIKRNLNRILSKGEKTYYRCKYFYRKAE